MVKQYRKEFAIPFKVPKGVVSSKELAEINKMKPEKVNEFLQNVNN